MATGQKTGGRQAGTPNKTNAATRERIETEADPIGFLIRAMNGEPVEVASSSDRSEVTEVYPTYEQRQSAAATLAKKVIPDAKDRCISLASMPKVEALGDATKAIASILLSVTEGHLTPSEGVAVSGIVESYRRTVETEEMERRIVTLEEQEPERARR